MALETFNYLNSLVAANPVVSDGLVNGDDHIRGIKLTLLNTFPNITGAVTATQDALNGAAGFYTNGASKLLSAGTFFSANATDGFQNTLAGDIDVVLQGTIAATFQRTAGVNFFKVNGGIQATGEIKGPGITPIGAAVMWFEDTLPTDGLWVWANGQIISNANTVAPVLLARWGSRFGGNGTTTMGVPNMQEVVPVGKSGMGGATAPGLLTSIATGVKDVLLALFGSDTRQLVTANLPPYTPAGSITNGAISISHNANSQNGSSSTGGGQFTGVTINAAASIGASQAPSTFNGSSQGGTSAAFGIMQPSRPVAWIIRIG